MARTAVEEHLEVAAKVAGEEEAAVALLLVRAAGRELGHVGLLQLHLGCGHIAVSEQRGTDFLSESGR